MSELLSYNIEWMFFGSWHFCTGIHCLIVWLILLSRLIGHWLIDWSYFLISRLQVQVLLQVLRYFAALQSITAQPTAVATIKDRGYSLHFMRVADGGRKTLSRSGFRGLIFLFCLCNYCVCLHFLPGEAAVLLCSIVKAIKWPMPHGWPDDNWIP